LNKDSLSSVADKNLLALPVILATAAHIQSPYLSAPRNTQYALRTGQLYPSGGSTVGRGVRFPFTSWYARGENRRQLIGGSRSVVVNLTSYRAIPRTLSFRPIGRNLICARTADKRGEPDSSLSVGMTRIGPIHEKRLKAPIITRRTSGRKQNQADNFALEPFAILTGEPGECILHRIKSRCSSDKLVSDERSIRHRIRPAALLRSRRVSQSFHLSYVFQ
jgi:hypothetical protein